jgi:antitoxin PrlF
MQVVPIEEGKTAKEMLSSVSPKGQITIPVAVRRLLGVKPKDTVAFAIKDGQVTISPARFSLESAFGSLEPPHGVEDIDELIQEAKEERAAKTAEQLREV